MTDEIPTAPNKILEFGTPEKFMRFWDNETFDTGMYPRYTGLPLDKFEWKVEIEDFKDEIFIVVNIKEKLHHSPFERFLHPTSIFETFDNPEVAIRTYNKLCWLLKIQNEEKPL